MSLRSKILGLFFRATYFRVDCEGQDFVCLYYSVQMSPHTPFYLSSHSCFFFLTDDGDIGWVKDLEDAALVRMLDDAGPSADAPPLMAAVATSVDAHAHGEKGDIQANADALVDPPSGAVSFSQEPTVQLPAAGDGEPEL